MANKILPVIEPLKAIYKKLGGEKDVENLSTTTELLQEIAEVTEGGGGGSALPDVTSADNGKVLGVDNGEWEVVNAPSGLPNIPANSMGYALTVNANNQWGAPRTDGNYGQSCIYLNEVYSDWFETMILQGCQGSLLRPYLINGAMPVFVRSDTGHGYEVGTMIEYNTSTHIMRVSFPVSSDVRMYEVPDAFSPPYLTA